MSYNKNANIWNGPGEHFFRELELEPLVQESGQCVRTCLAMLTSQEPREFHGVNTQDPVSWSEALKSHGMKLAYCSTDVRKLRYYLDEAAGIDDLFLLCYYCASDAEVMGEPDEGGWICGSHVVVLHRDKVLDPMLGIETPAAEHGCRGLHTKRLFRVVPAGYRREL